MSAARVQTTTIEREGSARPPTPQHAAFVEAQDRLLRHYGVGARSRYVRLERPAMRAHLLEAGQGEPAIILHGGDGQGVDWAPLMAHLQDGFHLHALDRPGFGLSDPFDYRRVDLRQHAADFVTSMLDALELERATILGGSMGGFFALATAFERPERVRALVLVGMTVGLSRQIAFPMRILCGAPGLANLFVARVGRPTAAARESSTGRCSTSILRPCRRSTSTCRSRGCASPELSRRGRCSCGGSQAWAGCARRSRSRRSFRASRCRHS